MNKGIKIDFSSKSSIYTKELDEIVDNTVRLIESIQILRNKYNEDGLLPLLPFKSDHENMMIIAKAIGQEAMKFAVPGVNEFCIFDEE
ncbi:MAG TPA: hypothetical protein DEP72_03865 [Clostridiales bacterium]|nr:MAG: hypothetical protein A2Y18_04140 [Clostridiales bacterium GWD2_32_19]HCC07284.1 hypothetical protein [Clostridiales bacterium]